MKHLTQAQIETLECINEFEIEFGNFPSLRELESRLNLNSRIAVYDRIMALVKKGFIVRTPNSKNKNVFTLSQESRVLTSGKIAIANSSKTPTQDTVFTASQEKPGKLKADGTSGTSDIEMRVGYGASHYGFSFFNLNSTSVLKIVLIGGYFFFASFCFKVGEGSWVSPSAFILVNAPIICGLYNLMKGKE